MTTPELRLYNKLAQRRWRAQHHDQVTLKRRHDYQHKYAQEHKEWITMISKARNATTYKAKRQAYYATRAAELQSQNTQEREAVLHAYGGPTPTCACCGESHYKHLTVDHIGGGANKHLSEKGNRLRGKGLYAWLKKNNYPPGFRILCMNCNWAIGKYGTCGHQDEGTSNLDKRSWTPFTTTHHTHPQP